MVFGQRLSLFKTMMNETQVDKNNCSVLNKGVITQGCMLVVSKKI